ncbi:hypothetical protein T492DRAFT_70595 [Pavlovales sp. CCMP2436]|nr:hypothetical protein T492DRAFT_70595 [Pavlovales sp. CCMP2436]
MTTATITPTIANQKTTKSEKKRKKQKKKQKQKKATCPFASASTASKALRIHSSDLAAVPRCRVILTTICWNSPKSISPSAFASRRMKSSCDRLRSASVSGPSLAPSPSACAKSAGSISPSTSLSVFCAGRAGQRRGDETRERANMGRVRSGCCARARGLAAAGRQAERRLHTRARTHI